MNTQLNHVRSGDPLHIAAATWNTFIDVARDHQARQRSIADNPLRPQTDSTRALLRNDSGSDLPRFGILGISGIVFDPAAALSEFQNQPVLTGITPAATHAGRFAIALEPIASGRIGQAILAGISPVQVNVTSTAHGFAEVLAGSAVQLLSAPTGSAQILYVQAGTGTRWAVVRVGSRGGPTGMFPVLVTQVGGAQGTLTTQASWTYNVTDLFGTTLGTGMTPLKRRPYFGQMSPPYAGAPGTGYYAANGAFVLFDANEIVDPRGCP